MAACAVFRSSGGESKETMSGNPLIMTPAVVMSRSADCSPSAMRIIGNRTNHLSVLFIQVHFLLQSIRAGASPTVFSAMENVFLVAETVVSMTEKVF